MFLTRMARSIRWFPAFLAAALCALATPAESGEWFSRPRLVAEGALGYDSNAYREAAGDGGASYLPFSLSFRKDVYRDQSSRLRFYATTDGSRYDGAFEDANRSRGSARLVYRSDLHRDGRNRLRLTLRGGSRYQSRTYVSRLAGEEYSVEVEGTDVSLADRFNGWRSDANASLVYGTSGWEAEGRGAFDHRNYSEDYDDVPEVQSLDSQTWEAGVSLRYGRRWRFEIDYDVAGKDYRALSARDMFGDLDPDVDRSYLYQDVGLGLSISTASKTRWTLDLGYRRNVDRHRGYFDYSQWSVEPGIRLPLGSRVRLEGEYAFRVRDYENARVSNDLDRPVRRDLQHRGEVELVYSTSAATDIFLEWRGIHRNEKNDRYDYDRGRAMLGVRLTLEGAR